MKKDATEKDATETGLVWLENNKTLLRINESSPKKRRPHKWTPPNPKESNYEKINQLLIYTLEKDFLIQSLKNKFLFPLFANLVKLVFDLQVFSKKIFLVYIKNYFSVDFMSLAETKLKVSAQRKKDLAGFNNFLTNCYYQVKNGFRIKFEL